MKTINEDHKLHLSFILNTSFMIICDIIALNARHDCINLSVLIAPCHNHDAVILSLRLCSKPSRGTYLSLRNHSIQLVGCNYNEVSAQLSHLAKDSISSRYIEACLLSILSSNNSTNKCEFSFDRVDQTLV